MFAGFWFGGAIAPLCILLLFWIILGVGRTFDVMFELREFCVTGTIAALRMLFDAGRAVGAIFGLREFCDVEASAPFCTLLLFWTFFGAGRIFGAMFELRFCCDIEATAPLCKLLFSFDVFGAGRAIASICHCQHLVPFPVLSEHLLRQANCSLLGLDVQLHRHAHCHPPRFLAQLLFAHLVLPLKAQHVSIHRIDANSKQEK